MFGRCAAETAITKAKKAHVKTNRSRRMRIVYRKRAEQREIFRACNPIACHARPCYKTTWDYVQGYPGSLMNKFLVALLALCSFAIPSRAWNAEGHMVVAQIAYNHLTPSVQAKCDALIAVPMTYINTGTTNFITAACWADDFKSQLNTANWHYIDIPFSLDGTSTNSFTPDTFDVVRAIRICEVALGNPTAAQSNQAVYLRYLLHFVGDIHQPLHASTAISVNFPNGDSGGNGFNLNGGGNLHSLWDGGVGFVSSTLSRPLSASNKTTLSNKVAVIEADYPYTPNPGVIADPMDWAIEGWNLAQTVSYAGITMGGTPSSTYTDAGQATAESRLAQAGHRLADVLNTIFTIFPATLNNNAPTNTTVSFWWDAVPGRIYHIQSKAILTDTWTDMTTVQPATGKATYTDTAGPTTKFYRVTE